MRARQNTVQKNTASAQPNLDSQEFLLSSIHKISGLLTRPLPLDKILISIVRESSQVFGLTRMAIFLINKNQSLLECRYIHGFNEHDSDRAVRFPYRLTDQDCVETRVVKKGKTIYVKDYQTDPEVTDIDRIVSKIMGRVSTIAVPLKIKQDVIGLITADKDNIRLKLSRRDIKAFTTFVNQASIIIENARLQEQNTRKIKQLLIFQEISKKTSSTFDLPKLANHITASALKLTRADSSTLFLVDEDAKNLIDVSLNGHSVKDTTRLPMVAAENAVVTAALSRQPAIIQHQAGQPPKDSAFIGSHLIVPLISEKRLLGVLQVKSSTQDAFSEDDFKLLLIFASHTASLIRNVRLYGQVMTERNFRENILESSPNSMISLNLDKEITSMNKRTEELFGFSRKDVIRKKADLVFNEDILAIIDLALTRHAVVNRKEVQHIQKSGLAIVLGITSSLLRNHQNNLIGAMIIVRDLTEEKRTEELIRRIDRLTSLGQLSAGIAHEIRNPLASIYFNVQLLAKKIADNDPIHSLINDTQEGINRIRTLVKGMLDFAKPSLPSLKSDCLARIIRDSVSLMDSQLKNHKVTISLNLPDCLPDTVLDAHQIHQVLVNLLLNGIEAMPGGGRIDIVLCHEPACEQHDERLVLSCTDHGTGIARSHLARIFNPFFTTKAEGTGLGLSIVHKILEQHQATVDVTSHEGKGTTFIIYFPVFSIG